MTSRTWVGGGNNRANQALDWTPSGAPQPGDTLDMQAGTMNIQGNDLAGNVLVIDKPSTNTAPTTVNLSKNANVSLDIAQFLTEQVTVNVKGSDTLNVQTEYPDSAQLTVNLADHTSLTGTFGMVFGSVVVHGGAGSVFLDNASSKFQGTAVTFDTAVKGTGAITVSSAQSSAGNLEFGGQVSRNQSVAVTGDPHRAVISHVLIDQPSAFKGSVALGVFGEVDLKGLANADSYQLRNDILSIYSGSTVIDTLRLTTPPPPSGPDFALTVHKTTDGVAIDHGPFNGTGTLLPQH